MNIHTPVLDAPATGSSAMPEAKARPDVLDAMQDLDCRVADLLEGVVLLENLRMDEALRDDCAATPPVDWTIARLRGLCGEAREAFDTAISAVRKSRLAATNTAATAARPEPH